LVVIYHILKDGTVYNDLGIDHFDRTNSQRLKNRLIKRLESLGYKVTVEENAAA